MSVVGFDFGNENCVVAVARQRGIDVVLNDESSVRRQLSCASRNEGPDGFPLIHARYLGEQRSFTLPNCWPWFWQCWTPLQLLVCILFHLIHETTATALAYGLYKTDLPEDDPLNVAFVDVGNSSMQVSIVGFKKGQLKVLAHSFDDSLGGRDFDEVLFRHFASKFKEEYKIDVYQNARACLRLRAGCEKLKKVLSANPEAPLNVECLMDEKDHISVPILERVKEPLKNALSDAGLSVENIHAVEVVGSGSRIPAIIRILTEFFGKEPRRTMNASECVARGCALQCAILSPTFKVRDFQVILSLLNCFVLEGTVPNSQTGVTENQQVVFPKGNPIPSVKALTFFRSSTFSIDVLYAAVSEVQVPATISTCTCMGYCLNLYFYWTGWPFQTSTGNRAKLKVKVRLNLHGIVSIESATMIEEDGAEVPISTVNESAKEDVKMDTDEPKNKANTAESDVSMEDAKSNAEASVSEVENGATETEDKPVQMETDIKARKKKTKATVPVSESIHGGLPASDLQKAIEKEFEMALQDRVMEETKDKKNAVEAYVYDMRNKLHDRYQDFVTASEIEEFAAKLQAVEDWLYEEGEDETKGVYVAKLEELKRQGDPIEERYKENHERGPVIDQLVYCINSYREAALLKDPKFDHIEIADKQKVISECSEAEGWLREKKQQQDKLPKYATPVLYSADVKRKAEALDRFCRPIMTKPKPAPPKPQTPAGKRQKTSSRFSSTRSRSHGY
ncbi:unnamed protein product [Spirodela intermedia]|uniref:Uncharacterized protein n=1 Tax=Spirodela intermedia TaxID=51605 RepID=A0A7I8JNH9_SPIIN|nr:unnamed protein product [Spirodela intermedia]CAA6671718.1 unnamed protein product [Spirodela intermedia]